MGLPRSSRSIPSALYRWAAAAEKRSRYGEARPVGYIGYSRSSPGSLANALAVARLFRSAKGSPVTTNTCHGWRFPLDGARAAAASTRSSTSLAIGSSLNARTALRLSTASYTSTSFGPLTPWRAAMTRGRSTNQARGRTSAQTSATSSGPYEGDTQGPPRVMTDQVTRCAPTSEVTAWSAAGGRSCCGTAAAASLSAAAGRSGR